MKSSPLSPRPFLCLLTLMLSYSVAAQADLKNCFSVAKRSIEECDAKYVSIANDVNKADMNLQKKTAGLTRTHGGASDLMNAANENSAKWATLPNVCKESKRKCADACNSVSAAEKPRADEYKYKCFGAIEERISLANQLRDRNASAANQAAASGNEDGAQGEAHLEGSNDKPCADGETCGPRNPATVNVDGETNYQALVRLQMSGFNCAGGSSITCTGKSGDTFTIPNCSGCAHQPFTGY